MFTVGESRWIRTRATDEQIKAILKQRDIALETVIRLRALLRECLHEIEEHTTLWDAAMNELSKE